jgi:hypothetical protein
MAINSVILEVVTKVAHTLPPTPRKMLCLGYPDMLVTEAQLSSILGAEAASGLTYRDDSASIVRWHKLDGQISRIAETRSVLGTLGIESDFVDIVASRGFETVIDLNQPAPAELRGQYDIVYDGGTMEHCFNVGQVMSNICSFARVGGFIVHVNPINYYNHGFFNFNPTFYHDWYTQSGNAIVSPFYVLFGPVLSAEIGAVDATAAFRAPERAALMVVAAKNSAEEPAWPMQSKYLKTPMLKA